MDIREVLLTLQRCCREPSTTSPDLLEELSHQQRINDELADLEQDLLALEEHLAEFRDACGIDVGREVA